MPKHYFNRDLSWLAFNQRVLQEAQDTTVPLYERMKFLAIFSSNLEEFYRIRVAEWRRLDMLTKKTKKELREDPRVILKKIHKTVQRQLAEFDRVFAEHIVKDLAAHNIRLVNETMLNREQEAFVRLYFREKVQPLIHPVVLKSKKERPQLDERSIYLAVKLCDYDRQEPRKFEYVVTEIPSRRISRFLVLPEVKGKRYVMILGDVIRLCIKELFPDYELIEAYSIKLTRDAELLLEDEFSGSLLKKIQKSLPARAKGVPTRLLYDRSMPPDFLNHLRKIFGIGRLDLMPGGRYHNLSDLLHFPVLERKGMFYPAQPGLQLAALEQAPSLFGVITQRDVLLHFPYHTFGYVIRFLNEAAEDKQVRSIKITLYRAAKDSKIIEALVRAVENGKQVTVFVELKARFDEESNITYAKELEEAGVRILYSLPVLKVHAKLLCVEREEGEKLRRYCYLGTGNFNENTAKLYCDSALLTGDKYIGREVNSVFDILADTRVKREFKHLLVAPDHMRHDLITLIDQEIKNALKHKPASIFLKLNSLQDIRMIDKLYEASREGVKIKLIVRGICCLVPGIKGLSENIKVISIVDRFLEHARVFVFHNDGDPKVYLSSADLMERNLSRRFEVAFPVHDPALKQQVIDLLNIQWKDNVKVRVINKIQNNSYRKSRALAPFRAQPESYAYLKGEADS